MGTTVLDWLEKLSSCNSSTEEDSASMQALLHRIDFPKAVVVAGIVYTEGYGTLENPPRSIHTMAKVILEVIAQKA